MFGRYANEYVNKEQVMNKLGADCNPEHFPSATPKDVFVCALGIAETAAPADVVPVVYAQWEPIHDVFADDIFKCSHCGTWNHVKTVMGKPDWKYCPECAAKMQKE